MTLCLAFDCAGAACSAAVVERPAGGGPDRTLATRSEAMERGHASRLAPMVQETLEATGVRGADIDLLATTVGPGSFTGVRIGLAFGRGLALGWRAPLAGIGTLQALLAAAPHEAGLARVAAIDTKRGDWYAQFASSADGPFLTDVAALAARLAGRAALLVGEGVERLAGELSAYGGGVRAQLATIDAARVAGLALDDGAAIWAERNRTQGRPPPLYLRGADVTLPGGVRTTA